MNTDVLTIDGTFAPDAQRPAFYFDLAPIFQKRDSRHADRTLLMCEQCARRAAPGELVLFKHDGFFLVIQSGAAADAVAQAVNVALVELFFGTESLSELSTLFRTAEHAEMVQSGVMDAGMVSTPAMPARQAPKRPDLEKVEADPIARLAESGVPGYEGLRAGFLPMVNLRRDAASIFFVGPVGRQNGKPVFGSAALAQINPQDRPAIDHAMLEYAIGFARAVVPTKFAAAIGTSVSYETLAWSRGRRLYQEALRDANVANNPFLIVKIENVPAGTTVARLAEIVATIRPYVKRVFLELPDCETGLTFSGQIGAAGLISSLSPNASPNEAARVAARLVRTAIAQQAVACMEGVENTQILAQLRVAGIRFAAGRISEDALSAPMLPSAEGGYAQARAA